MNIKNKKNYLVSIFILFFLVINFCSAAFLKDSTKNLIEGQANVSAIYGGYDTSGDVFVLVQTGISAFLSLIGVILLVYLLSAGYKWMTAHGEEEKVTEAKDTIKRAIVGVIIIVAAYAISVFVMARLEAGILKGDGGNLAPTMTPQAPISQ